MPDPSLADHKVSFAAFSHLLDARILRALADMGFARPTLVQAKAIPLALESRDILARARTGSGKTAAYCIPVVQKVLSTKRVGTAPRPYPIILASKRNSIEHGYRRPPATSYAWSHTCPHKRVGRASISMSKKPGHVL